MHAADGLIAVLPEMARVCPGLAHRLGPRGTTWPASRDSQSGRAPHVGHQSFIVLYPAMRPKRTVLQGVHPASTAKRMPSTPCTCTATFLPCDAHRRPPSETQPHRTATPQGGPGVALLPVPMSLTKSTSCFPRVRTAFCSSSTLSHSILATTTAQPYCNHGPEQSMRGPARSRD